MTNERLLEILKPRMKSSILMCMDSGVCDTENWEEFCKDELGVSRAEVEEIIGMDIEEFVQKEWWGAR